LIELLLFVIGILLLISAGIQDLKTRTAYSMYFVPSLIGFGLSPFLGAMGLIGTLTIVIFWNTEWNKVFGLADALLALTAFIGIFNPVGMLIVFITAIFLLIEIFPKRNEPIPLIWYAVKSFTLALMILFSLVYFGVVVL